MPIVLRWLVAVLAALAVTCAALLPALRHGGRRDRDGRVPQEAVFTATDGDGPTIVVPVTATATR